MARARKVLALVERERQTRVWLNPFGENPAPEGYRGPLLSLSIRQDDDMTDEEIRAIFAEVDERRKKYGDEAMYQEGSEMGDVWSSWDTATIKEDVEPLD